MTTALESCQEAEGDEPADNGCDGDLSCILEPSFTTADAKDAPIEEDGTELGTGQGYGAYDVPCDLNLEKQSQFL